MYMWAAWGGKRLNLSRQPGAVNAKNYDNLPPLDYLLSYGYVDDAGDFVRGGYLYEQKLGRDFDGLVAIDLESWGIAPVSDFKKLMSGQPSFSALRATKRIIAKYLTVLEVARAMFPKGVIGWYGLAGSGYPVSKFPLATKAEMHAWRQINDEYAAVFAKVDVMLPSLYFSKTIGDRKTEITDEQFFEKMRIVLKEQRRIAPEKKVISFMSPFYMDEYPTPVSLTTWKSAIEIAQQMMDGVILWSKPAPTMSYREIEKFVEIVHQVTRP